MSETAQADVEYTYEENDNGHEHSCVVVTCQVSGDQAGPVWGHGDASVRRALAELTETCSCGADWHEEDQ